MSEICEGIDTKRKTNLKLDGKKVIDTKTGFVYNSMHEAAEANGLKRYNLSSYLTGRTKNITTLKYSFFL